MTRGPRTALQVTPQLLTPSQLMGAEGAVGRLGSEAAPGCTRSPLADLWDTPWTSRDPHPLSGAQAWPRAHLIPWPPPSVQGWTQAPSQRGETLSADVCWDSGHTEGLLSPGLEAARMPACAQWPHPLRSGETACEQRREGRPQAAVRARSPRGRSACDLVSYRRQCSLSGLS